MPIPSPRSGESDSEFMSRCISFLVDEGKPQEQAVAICRSQLSKGFNPICHSEPQKDMYWKTFDRRRWGFLGWGQQRIKKALDDQIKPVMEALERSVGDAKENLVLVNEAPIQQAFIDLYGKVGAKFGMQVYRSVKAGAPQMETKQVEEDTFLEFMKEWVKQNGLERVQGVTRNTRVHLRQALEKGLDEGMGIEEIARMISGSRRIAGLQRARVIARTEIISASNRGSLEGARRTNLNLNKEWISTRDGRTRTFADGDDFDHFQADGQVVSLEQPFTVKGVRGNEQLMFPGDPTGSPGNVIQCRCTQAYIPK